MKNFLPLFISIFFLTQAAAQIPQAISYQAVARSAGGTVLANQAISAQVSILDGSPSGPDVYIEKHATVTNQYGLFILSIGTGNPVAGDFSTIDWSLGSYWLKMEIDV